MHTYNTQEALREAIKLTFRAHSTYKHHETFSFINVNLCTPICYLQPRRRQSSLSVETWWLCRYLYMMSKIGGLLPVFLTFLSTTLGFTHQTLGAMYVSCWRVAILLSLSLCRLQSLRSSILFRLCLSISVPRQNVKCFIEHMLCIVRGVHMHSLCTGPNNKTFYKHTYIH